MVRAEQFITGSSVRTGYSDPAARKSFRVFRARGIVSVSATELRGLWRSRWINECRPCAGERELWFLIQEERASLSLCPLREGPKSKKALSNAYNSAPLLHPTVQRRIKATVSRIEFTTTLFKLLQSLLTQQTRAGELDSLGPWYMIHQIG